MAWRARTEGRKIIYTSPSGVETEFDYENVSRVTDKLGAHFEFPGFKGSFVQDLGNSGERYKIKAFFWGPTCDEEADAFEESLRETGVGTLDHPLYGGRRVVPVGAIERRDDLKTRANQSIVSVTFWETEEAIFQAPQGTLFKTQADLELEFMWNQRAEQLEDQIDTNQFEDELTFREQVLEQVNNVRARIRDIADTVDEVREEFDAIYDSIVGGINELVGAPLTIGFQVLQLAQLPARAASLIGDKLDGYRNLLGDITSRSVSLVTTGSSDTNELATLDTTAQGTVAGAAVAAYNTDLQNQEDVIQAIDGIQELYDQLVEWRDDEYNNLTVVDTGEGLQALQQFISTVQRFLLSQALQLPQQRIMTLQRPRALVELVAELYGDVDDRLDEFIALNRLTGSEILEIPTGRRITYYVTNV